MRARGWISTPRYTVVILAIAVSFWVAFDSYEYRVLSRPQSKRVREDPAVTAMTVTGTGGPVLEDSDDYAPDKDELKEALGIQDEADDTYENCDGDKAADDLADALEDAASLSARGSENEEYVADEDEAVIHELVIRLGPEASMEVSNITETGQASPSDNETWIRSFHIESEGLKPISVSVTESQIEDAESMHRHSFQSSLVLGMLIHADPEVITNSSVLELGSSGFAGRVLSHFSKKVVMADTNGSTIGLTDAEKKTGVLQVVDVDPTDSATYHNETFDVVIASEGAHPFEGSLHVGLTDYFRKLAVAIKHHLNRQKIGHFLMVIPTRTSCWLQLVEALSHPHPVSVRKGDQNAGISNVYVSKTVNATTMNLLMSSKPSSLSLETKQADYTFLHAVIAGASTHLEM
mmetsp:Transcript_28422/g.55296  ORF Transcript_28422/g.55296 Transcript_28422/m.55296 type:complete len:407 (-) Transcript_28422:36-1256(-)